MNKYTKNKIKSFVASGRTGRAIDVLLQYRSNDVEISNEIIAISARYKNYLRERHGALQNSPTLDIELHKINNSILYIIEDETELKQSFLNTYGNFFIIAFFVIVTATFVYLQLNPKKQISGPDQVKKDTPIVQPPVINHDNNPNPDKKKISPPNDKTTKVKLDITWSLQDQLMPGDRLDIVIDDLNDISIGPFSFTKQITSVTIPVDNFAGFRKFKLNLINTQQRPTGQVKIEALRIQTKGPGTNNTKSVNFCGGKGILLDAKNYHPNKWFCWMISKDGKSTETCNFDCQ